MYIYYFPKESLPCLMGRLNSIISTTKLSLGTFCLLHPVSNVPLYLKLNFPNFPYLHISHVESIVLLTLYPSYQSELLTFPALVKNAIKQNFLSFFYSTLWAVKIHIISDTVSHQILNLF